MVINPVKMIKMRTYSFCVCYIGVQLYEGVSVEGVLVKDGKVAGVSTNRGDVECEIFVNCAGQVCPAIILVMFFSYLKPMYLFTIMLTRKLKFEIDVRIQQLKIRLCVQCCYFKRRKAVNCCMTMFIQ